MLKLSDIFKVGKFMGETGRDIFGNEENREYPVPCPVSKEGNYRERNVRVCLDYEFDSKTGDMRIVQR